MLFRKWGLENRKWGHENGDRFIFTANPKTASGVFTWDTWLRQGKIARKLKTALGKTGRFTPKGVRHNVPGAVL